MSDLKIELYNYKNDKKSKILEDGQEQYVEIIDDSEPQKIRAIQSRRFNRDNNNLNLRMKIVDRLWRLELQREELEQRRNRVDAIFKEQRRAVKRPRP